MSAARRRRSVTQPSPVAAPKAGSIQAAETAPTSGSSTEGRDPLVGTFVNQAHRGAQRISTDGHEYAIDPATGEVLKKIS